MRHSHVLSAVLIALIALPGAAAAQSAGCAAAISATARAPNGAFLDPPQTYDTQKLALRRARQAWQQAAQSQCPGYSNAWKYAQNKSVDCEGYAGGVSCVVTARPAKL